VTQAAWVFGDGYLGTSLLRVSQARIGQVIGNVRGYELQSAIPTRMHAFLPPEQFATGSGHDTCQ
jgi:hypothetical protein